MASKAVKLSSPRRKALPTLESRRNQGCDLRGEPGFPESDTEGKVEDFTLFWVSPCQPEVLKGVFQPELGLFLPSRLSRSTVAKVSGSLPQDRLL